MRTSSFDDTDYMALERAFVWINRRLWKGIVWAAVVVLAAQWFIARHTSDASLSPMESRTWPSGQYLYKNERCLDESECSTAPRRVEVRYSPRESSAELVW
jgi:hypothetical protein